MLLWPPVVYKQRKRDPASWFTSPMPVVFSQAWGSEPGPQPRCREPAGEPSLPLWVWSSGGPGNQSRARMLAKHSDVECQCSVCSVAKPNSQPFLLSRNKLKGWKGEYLIIILLSDAGYNFFYKCPKKMKFCAGILYFYLFDNETHL